MTAPGLVVVVGPTGAGKSALSLQIAQRIDAEVISSDSQQVYRGMDIGTGKLSLAERAGVPHHLLDVANPDEEMTAARFAELADAAIADIAARGKRVVLCGGTGLYVRALLLGLFAGPPADAEVRAKLEDQIVRDGLPALWQKLRAVDPALAAKVDERDKKRIIRALEVFTITGVAMSEHWKTHDHTALPARYPVHMVGLEPLRATLYAGINARVDGMMAAGLLAEVDTLRAAGYLPPLRSQQAIGYAELHAVRDGQHTLSEAVELIKRNSRHYARRQLTWYRRDTRVAWFPDAQSVDFAAIDRFVASNALAHSGPPL